MDLDTLSSIDNWHSSARPHPTSENVNVQLGCHLEELCEMLDSLKFLDCPAATILNVAAKMVADDLKSGVAVVCIGSRQDLLDSLADQIVTAVGVGHCANMDVPQACDRVDESNWSKYVDGQPLFNENGKIIKGPNYRKPDLDGLY